MLFYTVGQARAFLLMAAGGLAVGLWYDALFMTRRALAAGAVLTAAMDALFAVGALTICGVFLGAANLGEARLYCLLGAVCGFLLYRSTLHRLFWRAAGAIYHAVVRAGRRAAKWKFVAKLWK